MTFPFRYTNSTHLTITPSVHPTLPLRGYSNNATFPPPQTPLSTSPPPAECIPKPCRQFSIQRNLTTPSQPKVSSTNTFQTFQKPPFPNSVFSQSPFFPSFSRRNIRLRPSDTCPARRPPPPLQHLPPQNNHHHHPPRPRKEPKRRRRIGAPAHRVAAAVRGRRRRDGDGPGEPKDHGQRGGGEGGQRVVEVREVERGQGQVEECEDGEDGGEEEEGDRGGGGARC